MGKQNRVDPSGQLIFTTAKGRWMGNRGKLHNADQQVVRTWKSKAWITCETRFGSVKREIFSANSYSELFFLDEATALSAGHRPCAECRYPRYKEFKSLWCEANLTGADALPAGKSIPVAVLDARLHEQRIHPDRRKVTHVAPFGAVPSGAFVLLEDIPFLHWNGRLHQWAPDGYLESSCYPASDARVLVLTPESIVRLLRLGFKPQVHSSAEGIATVGQSL